MVADSYAVVYPWTVMVHFDDAPTADRAMMSANRFKGITSPAGSFITIVTSPRRMNQGIVITLIGLWL
jgi:hypothetical protein